MTTDSTITLMNKNIVHNGYPGDPAKPIIDIPGIWDMLNNGNMTVGQISFVSARGYS